MNEEIKERIDMINRGEVPKGYKKTKVGIIPEDWEVKSLDKYAKVIDGDRGKNYPNQKELVDDGVLFLSTKNIIHSNFDFDEKRFITIDKFNNLSKGKLQKGDLVITMRGSVGNVALFHGEQYKTAFINAQMAIIRPFKIENEFLWFFMNSNFTQNKIKTMSSGSAQPQLTKKVVEELYISRPQKKEQQRIAQILSTWDKAIELKEKLIEEKEEQKKGLMQRLLTGEVRLPGFEGEWEEVRLKSILDYEQPDKYIAEDIQEYSIKLIPVLTANKSFILGSTKDVQGIYQDIPVIIFDDFTTDSKYVDFKFKIRSSAIKLLKSKNDNIDLKFIYELMQLIKFPRGGHKRYYISEYQYLRLMIPKYNEQKAIAQILSTADKEIDLLNQELEQLKEQKKGLMQLLLTGKIRVSLQ